MSVKVFSNIFSSSTLVSPGTNSDLPKFRTSLLVLRALCIPKSMTSPTVLPSSVFPHHFSELSTRGIVDCGLKNTISNKILLESLI